MRTGARSIAPIQRSTTRIGGSGAELHGPCAQYTESNLPVDGRPLPSQLRTMAKKVKSYNQRGGITAENVTANTVNVGQRETSTDTVDNKSRLWAKFLGLLASLKTLFTGSA